MTRSLTLPHGLVGRASILLACAEGECHVEIAKRLGVSKMTVGKWRRRFHHQGREGRHGEQRPGPPRTHDAERVAGVIHTAWQSPPPNAATHWSVRTLAAHTGIFPSPRSSDGFSCFTCNPIATATARSPTIPTLWIRCRPLQVCI